MSETRWTPGPWKWNEARTYLNGGERGYDEVIDYKPTECLTYCYGGTQRIDINEANAKLIAAAPCLYAALDALVTDTVEAYKAGRIPAESWLKARAALAIARGATPTPEAE